MRKIILFSFLFLSSSMCPAAGTGNPYLSNTTCAPDALANLYAEQYSMAWSVPLADAFTAIDSKSIEDSIGQPLTPAQHERLSIAYKALVEKYYSKDVWLPGVRAYVNDNLTIEEQCSAFAYFQTEVGRKILIMQVTPGGSEFIRQQATNKNKIDPQFFKARGDMLASALPEIDFSEFNSNPIP